MNLYLVQNNLKRLGLVGLYTAVFAASVGILSSARRAELLLRRLLMLLCLVFVSGNLAAS